jgi:hypothetical protein
VSALPHHLLLVVFRAGVPLGRGTTSSTHDGAINALLRARAVRFLQDGLLLRPTLTGHPAQYHHDRAAHQVDLAWAEHPAQEILRWSAVTSPPACAS